MEQNQIDQISSAFLNAYKEFFGMEIQYIPFVRGATTQNDFEKMYAEADTYEYDETSITTFYGSINYEPEEKEITKLGFDPKQTTALITAVTKELVDKGLVNSTNNISFEDKIRIEDRFGNTSDYIITNRGKSVQFSDNFVFSKIGIQEESDFNE
jgi:hypothetical protein